MAPTKKNTTSSATGASKKSVPPPAPAAAKAKAQANTDSKKKKSPPPPPPSMVPTKKNTTSSAIGASKKSVPPPAPAAAKAKAQAKTGSNKKRSPPPPPPSMAPTKKNATSSANNKSDTLSITKIASIRKFSHGHRASAKSREEAKAIISLHDENGDGVLGCDELEHWVEDLHSSSPYNSSKRTEKHASNIASPSVTVKSRNGSVILGRDKSAEHRNSIFERFMNTDDEGALEYYAEVRERAMSEGPKSAKFVNKKNSNVNEDLSNYSASVASNSSASVKYEDGLSPTHTNMNSNFNEATSSITVKSRNGSVILGRDKSAEHRNSIFERFMNTDDEGALEYYAEVRERAMSEGPKSAKDTKNNYKTDFETSPKKLNDDGNGFKESTDTSPPDSSHPASISSFLSQPMTTSLSTIQESDEETVEELEPTQNMDSTSSVHTSPLLEQSISSLSNKQHSPIMDMQKQIVEAKLALLKAKKDEANSCKQLKKALELVTSTQPSSILNDVDSESIAISQLKRQCACHTKVSQIKKAYQHVKKEFLALDETEIHYSALSIEKLKEENENDWICKCWNSASEYLVDALDALETSIEDAGANGSEISIRRFFAASESFREMTASLYRHKLAKSEKSSASHKSKEDQQKHQNVETVRDQRKSLLEYLIVRLQADIERVRTTIGNAQKQDSKTISAKFASKVLQLDESQHYWRSLPAKLRDLIRIGKKDEEHKQILEKKLLQIKEDAAKKLELFNKTFFDKQKELHTMQNLIDERDMGSFSDDMREDATFHVIRKHQEIEVTRFESIMSMVKEDHLSRLVSLECSALRTLENTSKDLFNAIKAEKIQLAMSLEQRTKTLRREAAKMGDSIKRLENLMRKDSVAASHTAHSLDMQKQNTEKNSDTTESVKSFMKSVKLKIQEFWRNLDSNFNAEEILKFFQSISSQMQWSPAILRLYEDEIFELEQGIPISRLIPDWHYFSRTLVLAECLVNIESLDPKVAIGVFEELTEHEYFQDAVPPILLELHLKLKRETQSSLCTNEQERSALLYQFEQDLDIFASIYDICLSKKDQIEEQMLAAAGAYAKKVNKEYFIYDSQELIGVGNKWDKIPLRSILARNNNAKSVGKLAPLTSFRYIASDRRASAVMFDTKQTLRPEIEKYRSNAAHETFSRDYAHVIRIADIKFQGQIIRKLHVKECLERLSIFLKKQVLNARYGTLLC